MNYDSALESLALDCIDFIDEIRTILYDESRSCEERIVQLQDIIHKEGDPE